MHKVIGSAANHLETDLLAADNLKGGRADVRPQESYARPRDQRMANTSSQEIKGHPLIPNIGRPQVWIHGRPDQSTSHYLVETYR